MWNTNLDILQAILDKLQLSQLILKFDFISKNEIIAANKRLCHEISQ